MTGKAVARLVVAALTLGFSPTGALAHKDDEMDLPPREYQLKARGEINLVDDTMIRDRLLPRGRYVLQHRVKGDEHEVEIGRAHV